MFEKLWKKIKGTFYGADKWLDEMFKSGDIKEANKAFKLGYNKVVGNFVKSKAAKMGFDTTNLEETTRKGLNNLSQGAKKLFRKGKNASKSGIDVSEIDMPQRKPTKQEKDKAKKKAASEAKREEFRKKYGLSATDKKKGISR